MISYERLGYLWAPTPADFMRIEELKRQLSSKPKVFDKEHYADVLGQSHLYLFVARAEDVDWAEDHKILGMATVYVTSTVSARIAHIEDVVVDNRYRGRGIGKRLTQLLIATAKSERCDFIELTSNPRRIEAHALYEKLGFEQRDTDVLRLPLTHNAPA